MGPSRPTFAALATLLLIGWVPVHAQERVHRIAVVVLNELVPAPPEQPPAQVRRGPYLERLAQLGYERGRNLEVRNFARRVGDADERGPWRRMVIEEALAWSPDVVFVQSTREAQLLRQATSIVPIVFANVQDPVSAGLVSDLARPGANVTGAAMHYDTIALKRIELVAEVLPRARRLLLLSDRQGGGVPPRTLEALRAAAQRLHLELHELDVADGRSGPCGAIERVRKLRPHAIMTFGNFAVPSDTPSDRVLGWMSTGYGKCLATLQSGTRAPVFDDSTDTVQYGVAFALGEDQFDSFRRAAQITARILAGARPADTPVDVQMRVRLHVNARSVRELGIALPPSILVRADGVVD